MMSRWTKVFVFALSAVTISFSAAQAQMFFGQPQAGYALPVQDNQIKFMNWNVENFFNAVHNPGKQDWEFLPVNDPEKAQCRNVSEQYRRRCISTNWTVDGVKLKLNQVATVIKAQGVIPDVLTLQEVEGEDIVAAIAGIFGYKYVFFEGDDERGIDTAILFLERNLKFVKADMIPMSQTLRNPSRPIIRAQFTMRGSAQKQALAIFVNHWPSQRNPPAERIAYAQALQREIEKGMEFFGPENFHAIATGDFNTVDTDQPNPINDVMLSPKWRNAMVDTEALSDRSPNPMNGIMPPGSYLYDGRYNRLDRILISRSFVDGRGPEVLPETFRVFAPAFMVKRDSRSGLPSPIRYNHSARSVQDAGFSDHWPVSVLFRFF